MLIKEFSKPDIDNAHIEYLECIYKTKEILIYNFSRQVFGISLLFAGLISHYFLFWHFLSPLPYIALGILFPPILACIISFLIVEKKRRLFSEFNIARYLDEKFKTHELFFTALENNHRVMKNDCNKQLILAANHLSRKVTPFIRKEEEFSLININAIIVYFFLFLAMLIYYLLHLPPEQNFVQEYIQLKQGGRISNKRKIVAKKGAKESSSSKMKTGANGDSKVKKKSISNKEKSPGNAGTSNNKNTTGKRKKKASAGTANNKMKTAAMDKAARGKSTKASSVKGKQSTAKQTGIKASGAANTGNKSGEKSKENSLPGTKGNSAGSSEASKRYQKAIDILKKSSIAKELGKAIASGKEKRMGDAAKHLAKKLSSNNNNSFKRKKEFLKILKKLKDDKKPLSPDLNLSKKVSELEKAVKEDRLLDNALKEFSKTLSSMKEMKGSPAAKKNNKSETEKLSSRGFTRFSTGKFDEKKTDAQNNLRQLFNSKEIADRKGSKVKGYFRKYRIPYQYRKAIQLYFKDEK
ncbi:hypothetical protein ACFL35_07440 [Candidatus Riflebacteria bacterium]